MCVRVGERGRRERRVLKGRGEEDSGGILESSEEAKREWRGSERRVLMLLVTGPLSVRSFGLDYNWLGKNAFRPP